MSAGFIVIPLGEEGLDAIELRELAAGMQARIVFLGERAASHFIDERFTVETILQTLVAHGHSFPNCEACP